MISVLVFIVAWVLGLAVPWYAYLVTGFADGVIITPLLSVAVVPFLPRLIREQVGRLYALYAAVLAGDHAIVQRADGYEIAPIEDGEIYCADGTVIELAEAETNWYRLANRRLALVAERDDQVVGSYVDEDIRISDRGDTYALLERTSGGWPLVTKYADYFREGVTDLVADGGAIVSGRLGHVVYSPYVYQSLPEAADTTQSEDAEEKSKRDHGGDGSVSARVRTVAALVALVSGGLLGLALVILL